MPGPLPSVSIAGYVLNSVSHAPIPGATVTLSGVPGLIVQPTTTDETGYYSFPLGQYYPDASTTVAGSYPGYAPSSYTPTFLIPSQNYQLLWQQNIWLTPLALVTHGPFGPGRWLSPTWPWPPAPTGWSGWQVGPLSPDVIVREQASRTPITGKGPSQRRKRPSRRPASPRRRDREA
jgi:hypothetical protein